MTEPDITALARRLAEQNNVDWRDLSGSGDGGRIVERDVLDYLARVMAGDEAIDPTPEPLPDGMEAWPDQDVGFGRGGGASPTSLGEIRQEIGRSAGTERSAAPDSGGPGSDRGGPGAEAPVTDVGEDVFLFEDEQPASAGAEQPYRQPGAADDLDDLLVAGDDEMSAGDDGPAPLAGQDGRDAADLDDDFFGAVPAAHDAASLADSFEDPNQPFGGTSSFAADGAPPRNDADGGGSFGTWSLGNDLPTEADIDASEDDLDLFAASDGASTAEADVERATQEDMSDLFGAEPESDTHAPETPAASPTSLGVDVPASSPDGDGRGESEQEEGPAAWSASGTVHAEDAGQSAWSKDDVTETGTGEGSATGPWAAGSDLGAEVRESEPSGDTAPFASLPLARFSTVLRRHVDVSALAAAQLAAAQETGRSEPLAAAPFLLRAVAKAARDVDVAGGQIALAVLADRVTLRRVDGAADRPFSQVVGEVVDGSGEEDEAGLVVADLSGLDVDEVVLDLGMPVLTLGRILYDNQRGGYRSTLTLAGDVPADRGARLLSRVAELLDSPVRLVM